MPWISAIELFDLFLLIPLPPPTPPRANEVFSDWLKFTRAWVKQLQLIISHFYYGVCVRGGGGGNRRDPNHCHCWRFHWIVFYELQKCGRLHHLKSKSLFDLRFLTHDVLEKIYKSVSNWCISQAKYNHPPPVRFSNFSWPLALFSRYILVHEEQDGPLFPAYFTLCHFCN